MTGLEVLRWMHRGYPLRLRYNATGNFWFIAGEKCTPAAAGLLRRGEIEERPCDNGKITAKGFDRLRKEQ